MTKQTLRYKRALVMFLLAYVGVTIVAVAFSFLVDGLLHAPSATAGMKDLGFQLTLPYEPLMNLACWMAGAAFYFSKRVQQGSNYKEALALGALWLVIALPVDFVGFVVIPSPISLNVHDFYLGQFPWIYLTYLAVLLSPLCYVILVKLLLHPRNKAVQQAA